MKTFDEKSKANYNQKADNYNNTFDGKFTVMFKKLLLKEVKIEGNSNVLDIACGNGTFLKMLSEKNNIKGYGSDISEKMIENAKKTCADMTFEVAGCEHISFETQLFDIITVCAAYHHFPNVSEFAKEASRLLKPKGMLYVADIYYSSLFRIICNPFVPLSKAGDVKFYSPKEIANNFIKHGFKQVGTKKNDHIQIITLQKL